MILRSKAPGPPVIVAVGAVITPAPGPFTVVPLAWFTQADGHVEFDLEHCSEQAAINLAVNDPEHWELVGE